MAETQIGMAAKAGWWSMVVRGLLALSVGILILVRPMDSVGALALFIAFWAVMQGITTCVHAFELRSVASHWWVLLLSGLLSWAFGLAAFYYYPGLSLAFAVAWVSWWLLLGGFVGIWVGMMEKSAGMPWGWTITVAVLTVLAGIFAFLTPPVTIAALLSLIAVFAIITGVFWLMAAFRIRSAADTVGSVFRPA